MPRPKKLPEDKAMFKNYNFKFNPADIYDLELLKLKTGKSNMQLMRLMMGLSMEMLTIDEQLEKLESDPKIK